MVKLIGWVKFEKNDDFDNSMLRKFYLEWTHIDGGSEIILDSFTNNDDYKFSSSLTFLVISLIPFDSPLRY